MTNSFRDDLVICTDWGTTNLRLFLVNSRSHEVLAHIAFPQGILNIHHRYQQEGSGDRISFYRSKLHEAVVALGTRSNQDLYGLDVIISGMAGSSIGMIELPYGSLPFSLANDRLKHTWIGSTPQHPNRLLLCSGLAKADDVMRGEEVQVIGWQAFLHSNDSNQLILPGTHSKHIRIEDGQLVDFQTFMTGEVFQLLLNESILRPPGIQIQEDRTTISASFFRGIDASYQPGWLHELFRIRALMLRDGLHSTEVSEYLSGLLIGSELRQLSATRGSIHLAASGQLLIRYRSALEKMGFNEVTVYQPSELTKFTIAGQIQVWKKEMIIGPDC